MSKKRSKLSIMLVVGMGFLLIASMNSVYGMEKTTIRLIHWYGLERGKQINERWIREFQTEHPNMALKVDDVPYASIYDKAVIQFKGGRAPDVIAMGPDHLRTFVDMGMLEPLNPYIEKEGGEKFLKQYIQDCLYPIKGKIYQLPNEVGVQAIFYNRRMLVKSGVTPPTTWKEFVQSAQKVTNPAKGEYALTIPMHTASMGYYISTVYWPIMAGYGGDMIKDGKAAFNSKAGVEAQNFIMNFDKKYNILSPGILSVKMDQVRQRFAGESDAFMFDANFGWSVLKNIAPNLDFGVAEFPRGPAGRAGGFVGGTAIGLSSISEHKEAAWELVKYLTSKETLEWLCKGNPFPPNRELIKSPVYTENPQLSPFAYSLLHNRLWNGAWVLPQWIELCRIFIMGCQKAYIGIESTEEAFNEAASEWNKILR